MLTAPGFESATVVTPLGSVAYVTAGPNSEDHPASEPLVFFHGFGGGSSSYEWSLVYPAFTHRYRVLAPDLLGWGRSG
jgi:haloalkane dehalogenase